MLWERSISQALAAGASESAILALMGGFKSARTLDVLLRSEAGELDGFLKRLRNLVDDSAFGFAAWLAAFECVQTHLSSNGRSASADSVLGYVQCSAEFGGSAESRSTLPEIIEGMLEQYGFEGQEGCGTSTSG